MSQTPGGPQGAQTQLARYYLTNVGRKTYLEGRSGAYSQYAEGAFEKNQTNDYHSMKSYDIWGSSKAYQIGIS